MTRRGLRVLREAGAVICEERRVGSTLLTHLQIEKPLLEFNEHSRPEDVAALVERLQRGESLALISDHGTPLIEDPGAALVNAAIQAEIRVEPVPGASAVLAALVASGIPAPRFRFVGKLPPKQEARDRALRELSPLRETLVLLDAPYRLRTLVTALSAELGRERRAAVACNLTMPDEHFVRGTLGEIVEHLSAQPFKGEFVVIVQGNTEKGYKERSRQVAR
jgi:16S rRNA (cytidine1402-2'-O)-methyltransferase